MTIAMHHRTTVLEKKFDVSVDQVFAVWAEVEKRSLWNSPSDDVTIRYVEDDFSIGGKDVSLCLVGDQIVADVVGVYHDIVDNQRIIYTEIIKSDDMLLGTSQVSVSFASSDGGTEMIVTLQTCAVAGADVLDEVAAGWTASMAKMQDVLAG